MRKISFGVLTVVVIVIAVVLSFASSSRSDDTLYVALGVFLPLITVNCAILGASLFMVEHR